MSDSTYRGARYGFDRLLGTQFFHGIVVLFLLLCHEQIFSTEVHEK